MQRVVLRAAAVVAALVSTPVAGAWTWPANGPVLQPFVFDPLHPYAGGQHRGIDVGEDAGAPVLAPVGGTISFAGSVPSSGKSVTIQTPDGLSVTLTHLGTIGVIRNAVVAEGGAVGTAGPSGTPEVAEPYLHLGVRITAQEQGYVDPLAFLPARVTLPPPVPEPPAPVVAVPAAPAPAEPAPSAVVEQTASPATVDPGPSTPEGATDPTFLQPVDGGSHPEATPKDVAVDPKATAESAQSGGAETEAAVRTPDVAPSSATQAGYGGDTDSSESVTTVTLPTADSVPATPEAGSPSSPAAAVAEPRASTPEPVTPSASETPATGSPPGPTTSTPGSGGKLESPDALPVSRQPETSREEPPVGEARPLDRPESQTAINPASQPTATGPAYGRTGEPATHRGGRSIRSRSGAWVQEPVPADAPKPSRGRTVRPRTVTQSSTVSQAQRSGSHRGRTHTARTVSGHIVDAIDRAAAQPARPWRKLLAAALAVSLVALATLGGGFAVARRPGAPVWPQPPVVDRLAEPVEESAVVAESPDEPDADSAPVPLRWTACPARPILGGNESSSPSPGRMRPARVTSAMWRRTCRRTSSRATTACAETTF